MNSGLVLLFNVPALIGTVVIFLGFWFYFNYFSLRTETILIRNFGDNLRNLYWLRKGKRFFWKLILITLIALVYNLSLYIPLIMLAQKCVKELNSILFREMMLVTTCFLIVIVWMFAINWFFYVIIFIYKKNKYAIVNVDFEQISGHYVITNLRLCNVDESKGLNKKIEKYANVFIVKITGKNENAILKYSLVLIELFCKSINEDNKTKIDANNFAKYVDNGSILSKKEFIIVINSYFSDSIQISY